MNDSTLMPMHKKVMVVDDNEVDRYIAARNIIKNAFAEEVILKESSESALDYLKSLAQVPDELPNLIFLDIRMPEIDGFGFLDEYQNLPESVKKNCIIIMLSTSLNPGDHERAKNNKYVNRFMNKPLNAQKILGLLEETIGLDKVIRTN